MQVFVPVSEGLLELLGMSPEDLVPFDLDYEVLAPGEFFAQIEAEDSVALSEG